MLGGLANDVRAMSPGAFFATATVLAGGACVAFWFIWHSLKRARIIEDTPTALVRSAPQGYVEIEGRGELMEGMPTVAPLSGMECLWFRYQVERREQRFSNNRQSIWRTVRRGTSDDIFLLRDRTGACVVDPDGAEVTPSVKETWYGSDDSGGNWSPGGQIFGMGNYRYTEERLLPGSVYAIGEFHTVNNAEAPLNDDVAALLRQWKRDQAELVRRFDSNGDGVVDMDEWAKVREEATAQVLRERAHSAADPVTNVLRKPRHGRQPFLLSAFPQERLASRYRRLTTLSFAGTFAALGALLWIVTVRFG